MTSNALESSAVSGGAMPAGLPNHVQALWLARAGNWHEAHDLCQRIPGSTGSWIHAYLHREEGDLGNASYWYARAGKPVPARDLPLLEEWRSIAKTLCG